MQETFVPTQNYQKFEEMIRDLMGASWGVELAAVIGRAGRGKTTAAERIFSTNTNTVYVLYQEDWSLVELIREITFKLSGTRPHYRSRCAEIIQSELAAKRRIIMVDEADLMNRKCLNGLRNIHDICSAPIVLIGEEDLTRQMGKERRLISRVRQILTFKPVTQPDVVLFYKDALGEKLSPGQAATLLKHSGGDFRKVLLDALAIEKSMKSSGIDTISDAVINKVVD